MQGQPPSQHISDPEALRNEYKRILFDLTFNCKPIITNLTIMAQENKQGATTINGMPDGRPVFSRSVIEPIERAIRYVQQQQPPQPQAPNSNRMRDPRQRHSGPPLDPSISPHGINPALSQHQAMTPQQTDMMANLQSMMGGLSQDNNNSADPTAQILLQIQSLLPTLPATQAAPIQQYLAQILQSNGGASPSPQRTGSPAVLNASLPQSENAHSRSPILRDRSTTPIGTPPPTHAQAPLANMNTADLMKNLTSLGLLGGNQSSQTSTARQDTNTSPADLAIIAMGPFKLDSKDLQRIRKGAVDILYTALPLKCKQCGFRYPDTEEGKKKMDAHLDFHFRQNRRSKERAKRGLSRSWFVTEDEWINGVDIETTNQHAPIFADEHGQNGGTGGSSQTKKKIDEADADAHMVVVPSDSQGKPCPICGEQFITIWNDSEEEWMYKNAINVNGTIYHASCHADASGNMEIEIAIPDAKKRKAEDDLNYDNKKENFHFHPLLNNFDNRSVIRTQLLSYASMFPYLSQANPRVVNQPIQPDSSRMHPAFVSWKPARQYPADLLRPHDPKHNMGPVYDPAKWSPMFYGYQSNTLPVTADVKKSKL
ncbi:hypothetical protein NQZ79_g5384 [Umbelopsis isabellina]|nr:hypothetical protein NQZ79_g5384 [Umbelopsis isabellina]